MQDRFIARWEAVFEAEVLNGGHLTLYMAADPTVAQRHEREPLTPL